MSQTFETTTQEYENAATELEAAARHRRTLSSARSARGCAHAWAATGYIQNAQDRMNDLAKAHASKSSLAWDPIEQR